jgi:phage terminase large subunit-like protein
MELADPVKRPILIKKLSTSRASGVLDHHWPFWARPSQLPPSDPDWVYWLMLAGRGSGKTRAGAEYIRQLKNYCSPIALVGRTWGEVRDVMVRGPAGLQAIAPPDDYPHWESGRGRLVWRNGAEAVVYSAERPDSLRGPQHMAAWCDELASWQYPDDTWSNLLFGLRLGHQPRAVITTTPRPIRLIKELIADPESRITRTSSYANRAQLAPSFFAKIIQRYEGTRLGRQEIYAELLEDVEGALWTLGQIDRDRWPRNKPLPDLARIVVAIDPAMTSGEDADETGIVVCGRDYAGHGYVLADISGHYLPAEWAREVIAQYRHPERPADRVVAEINNGGEMVEHTLRMLDVGIPFKAVHASRGKAVRAEPVSALYEQGKVHHVGTFAQLEDQMCNFVVDFDRDQGSPDRVDALVWAFTELLVDDTGTSFLESWGRW